MSHVTELATAQLTATDVITIELVEANETPAVVIVRWPSKPSVLHPRPSRPLPTPLPAPLPLPSYGWPRFDGTGCSGNPSKPNRRQKGSSS